MPNPLAYRAVVIGQGAALGPKTIERGAANTVLAQVVAGDEPAFRKLDAATMLGTSIVPVANGGTGSAVGAIAIMQFIGAAVPTGTSYLGRDDSTTEADIRFVCPVTGVIVAATVSVTAAPGAGQTFVYRPFLNGVGATNIGQIADTNTPLFTTGLAFAVTAGDTISLRVIVSGAGAITNHAATLAIRVDA
jgi:hypothetical protein